MFGAVMIEVLGQSLSGAGSVAALGNTDQIFRAGQGREAPRSRLSSWWHPLLIAALAEKGAGVAALFGQRSVSGAFVGDATDAV